jgi:hypothetical protein
VHPLPNIALHGILNRDPCPMHAQSKMHRFSSLFNSPCPGWSWVGHAPLSGFGDCKGHLHFKGKEHNYVSVLSSSNTISIWGAALGRISAVRHPYQWDLDMYTDDVLKAKPFAKAVLRWLSESERLCREHRENEAAALHV